MRSATCPWQVVAVVWLQSLIAPWSFPATTTCTRSSRLGSGCSTATSAHGGHPQVGCCDGTTQRRRRRRGQRAEPMLGQSRMRACTCCSWILASPTACPLTATSTSDRSASAAATCSRLAPPRRQQPSPSHDSLVLRPCAVLCCAAQLSSVSSALSSFAALRSPSFLLLLCHYPLLSPTGGDYGAAHPWHGVDNGHRMLHVLNTGLASASHPLHAAALLHGHVHKGYRAELPLHPPSPLLSWSMPTLNPGSSGRSFSQQHQRAAAYNLYTIAWTPQRAAEAAATATDTAQPLQAAAQPDEPSAASGRWTLQVERFVHDGSAFQREPTAYTSGY